MNTSVFTALLLISSFAQAQSMQAGLWQAKTSLQLNGIPLPSSDDQECISKADAKDVKTTITKMLDKKGCSLTKWSLKGKKLEASLKCSKDDLEAEGRLQGTVTAKAYDLSGEADGSFKGIPSSATLKLAGQWLKACTP